MKKRLGNLLLLPAIGFAPLVQAQQQMQADSFTLSDYAGKVVYVDFWASWCAPCRASFPFMAKLSEQHGERLAIVAISVDEKVSDAQSFLSEFDNVPFDIVFDTSGELASKFNVPGMPTSYLFDRTGQLIGQHIGFRTKDKDAIRDWIAQSLER